MSKQMLLPAHGFVHLGVVADVRRMYRYLNIFYSTWGLLLGGLVFALPMMHMRIQDHTTDVLDDGASDTWDD